MRNTIIILIYSLIPATLQSQDTNFYIENFEIVENFEYETTRIDSNSSNYKNSISEGIKLIGLNASECNTDYTAERIAKRIDFIKNSDDTITIRIGFSEICCVSFLGDIRIIGDTVDLIYSTFGEECLCTCCYTLDYILKSDKKIDNFKLNGYDINLSDEIYKTYPIKFDIANGDTINYFDKYGFKQGNFIKFNRDNDTLYCVKFIDDIVVENKGYHKNGKIRYWSIKTNIIENGKIILTYPVITHFREWDKKGKLISDEHK